MIIDTNILIIIILSFLLILQISLLIVIRKLINNLISLTRQLNAAKIKRLSNYLLPGKVYGTCQNCHYRQTYVNTNSIASGFFYYHCKVNETGINLSDSCSKFEPEHTKTR